MAENTISMTLSQLVDLSLCSTEMGTVNFSILHALLQVLLQQINRSDVTVEFTGKDSERIQNILKATKPAPCVTLTEYKIVGDKRVKATEQEGKDTSDTDKSVVVVEAKESTIPQFSVTITKEQFSNIEKDINILKQQIQELKELPSNMDLIEATRDKNSPILDMFQIIAVSKRVDAVETSLEKIASLIEDLINQTQFGKGKALVDTVRNVRSSIDSLIREEISKIITKAEDIAEHVDSRTLLEDSIKSELEKIVTKIEESYEEIPKETTARSSIIDNITGRLNELCEKVEDLARKIDHLLEDVDKTQDITAELTDRLNVDEGKITELYDNLKDIQNQIQILNDITNKITEETDNYKKNYEAILEQIDFLRITKANHEDLQDALETKADTCDVNRKVSNDVFEVTCEEFSKAIEDAQNKLTQQEQLWLQALDNIQQDLGTKLDKVEFDALKDFINDKLKELQDRLQYLISLKTDKEAAGTKRKLIRDLNCLSCDKNVVMRKDVDPKLKSTAYPLPPPTSNMAPYIAYELDQLRTEQKTMPTAKNLNHFETILKTNKEPKRFDQDHLCTRYCGGNHTVTTAEQRVTRVGHFTQQWGVKVGPLFDDKYIRGIDNHLYKADPEVDTTIKKTPTGIIERKPSKQNIQNTQTGTVTAQKSNRRLQQGNDNIATGINEPTEQNTIQENNEASPPENAAVQQLPENNEAPSPENAAVQQLPENNEASPENAAIQQPSESNEENESIKKHPSRESIEENDAEENDPE